jgi:hypothetical protein
MSWRRTSGKRAPTRGESTGQHAASVEALFMENLVPREAFDAHVRFRPLDMRRFGELEGQRFHFLWSSCAIEHLGSLADGLDFVEQSMALLEPAASRSIRPSSTCRPTTRRSRSDPTSPTAAAISNGSPIGSGVRPAAWRRSISMRHAPIRSRVRLSAIHEHGRRHLKLLLGDFVCTSMLLVVHKGSPPT